MFKIGNLICTIGGKGVLLGIDYNPLKLPPNTIRVRTNDGNVPTKDSLTTYETATLVTGTSDVYDVYKSGSDLSGMLRESSNVTEVLGANTAGITNMSHMFHSCSILTTIPLFDTSSVTDMSYMFSICMALTSVPLFDTSNVTNMQDMFFSCYALTTVPLFDTSSVTDMAYMFAGCRILQSVPLFDTSSVTSMSYMFDSCPLLASIPLFDTSSVTSMSYMFNECTGVESGALALYQQASAKPSTPSHMYCFHNCGSNTVTGAAELAQIPSGWK